MSDFTQASFVGGMNLLSDDTRLQPNQYRAGFNLRNRYDILDQIRTSVKDEAVSIVGLKQGLLTFGEYIIMFVAGNAYYRKYDSIAWTRIVQFHMSTTASRYWTVVVPLAITNYGRLSATVSNNTLAGVNNVNSISAASQGNLPGLLVQDNTNQPQFIYIDLYGNVECRTTQTYAQWEATYDVPNNPVTLEIDNREYVPVGNAMAWTDGVLYITAQDGNQIYRSVSGRPLDFVINVDIVGQAGGDASTTSYTVGTGEITTLKPMSDGSLFVGATAANFIVTKDRDGGANLFGEFALIRKFLFEATCLSDRAIIESLGDTRFIDLTGVRSFNAVQQLQFEGRNAPFTATVASAFRGIIQDIAAAIAFDNYELYAVQTVYGNVILVFDTINNCWSSLDTTQTAGSKIKQFAKIELGVLKLFAITEDDQLYTLYDGDEFEIATLITPSFTSKAPDNSRAEMKLGAFRCILTRITEDTAITMMPVINNRVSAVQSITDKTIKYQAPIVAYSGTIELPDIDSMMANVTISTPNCEQGWKTSIIFTWNAGASLTQYTTTFTDTTHDVAIKAQQLVR